MPAFHTLVAAPVIDIDGTFFIQGAIYIALVFALNPLLFKPWLAALARREQAIQGALIKARALRSDADALVSEYDRKLDDARDRAATERSKTRREEEAAQAQLLAAARSSASAELDEVRARIDREAETARSALASRVDDLAGQITQKLLGRVG